MRSVRGVSVRLFAAAVLLAGCTSGPAAAPTTKVTVQPSPSLVAIASSTLTPATPVTTPGPSCPNRDGGKCLGLLAAGTYTTVAVDPTITYTVPAGWTNLEDLPGNFVLLPLGKTVDDLNANKSGYVGVYSSIAPPNGCEAGTRAGIAQTPKGISDWLATHPALNAKVAATSVGGRTGYVVDITMKSSWTGACAYSNGAPVVPLLVGVLRTGLDHNIGPGAAWRLYLLENHGRTMAIEVVDITGGGQIAALDAIAKAMVFAS